METEDKKLAVDVWKKAVDVQMHFNEIQLKIRQLAITVVVAASTAAGWILKEKVDVALGTAKFSAASGLFAVTALAMALFAIMDGLWYHRLLKGAGIYAGNQETLLGVALVGEGLSNTISSNSTVKAFGCKLNSSAKLWMFYGSTILIFVVAAILAWNTPTPEPKPVKAWSGTECQCFSTKN